MAAAEAKAGEGGSANEEAAEERDCGGDPTAGDKKECASKEGASAAGDQRAALLESPLACLPS